MKELDFDELDRAVNSLMGGIPKTVEPPKQDDVKVLTIASTLIDDTPPVLPISQPVGPTVEDEPAGSATPSVSPVGRVAAPALRRNGRFMDVIHPSAGTKAASSLGVSRQGVTIAPASETVDADTSATMPAEPQASTVDVPTAPAVVETVVPQSDEPQAWPDPLDFTQADTSSEPADEEVIEEVEIQSVDSEPAVETDEQPEPLSSPFIPDAKVEKRPLGNPAPEFAPTEVAVPEGAPESSVFDPIAEDLSDAQLAADVPAVELPEELQGDLMAIESDATASSIEEVVSREVPVEPSPAVTPTTPVTEEAPRAEPVAAAAMVTPSVATPITTGPVSIPQQYREEPSTGDVASGAIYDTASYHQPLEHPAKKKSGWLWVIWVLILLIVGAGGGALAYFYLLQ